MMHQQHIVIHSHIQDCNKNQYIHTNSYYNYGYADGYKDGQNKTGTVTFEQHHHSSGCYRTCTITHTYDYIGTYDGTIHANEFQSHSTCGLGKVNKGTTCPLTCDTYTSTHMYLVCGYSEGQILSATIVYN